MASVKKSLDEILNFENINNSVANDEATGHSNMKKSSRDASLVGSSATLSTSGVATVEDVDVQVSDSIVSKELAELDLSQMLAIIRNNGVFVKRSKTSYVRPENKVLPRQFLNKPLKATHLLKTDGLKKTWRNKNNVRKANSFLVVGDRVAGICNELDDNVKPSLVKNILKETGVNNGKSKSTQNIIFDSEGKTSGQIELKVISASTQRVSSDSDYSSDGLDLNRQNDKTTDVIRKYSCSLLDLTNSQFGGLTNSGTTSHGQKQNESSDSSKMILSLSLLDIKNVVEIVPKEQYESAKNKSSSKSFFSKMRTFSSSSSGSNSNNNSKGNTKTDKKTTATTTNNKNNFSANDLDTLGVFYEPDGSENTRASRPTASSLSAERNKKSHHSSKSPNNFVNRLISMAISSKESNKKINEQHASRSVSTKQLSNQDIEIISRFPIDSKAYRHYISGGKNNKLDKLANSVNINKIIDDEIKLRAAESVKSGKLVETARDTEYDSINDFQSSPLNSKRESKGKI
jgi:hypothetical protein